MGAVLSDSGRRISDGFSACMGQAAAGSPVHSARFLRDLRTPITPPPFAQPAPPPPRSGLTPSPEALGSGSSSSTSPVDGEQLFPSCWRQSGTNSSVVAPRVPGGKLPRLAQQKEQHQAAFEKLDVLPRVPGPGYTAEWRNSAPPRKLA